MHMHPFVTVLMILLGGAVAGIISGLLLVMPVPGVVISRGRSSANWSRTNASWRHRHAKELRPSAGASQIFTRSERAQCQIELTFSLHG